MSELDQLYYQLNRYYSLLSGIRSAVAALSSPNLKLDLINTSMLTNFSYDGKGVDNGKISNIHETIFEIINKVNNEVIPSINSNIYSINREIEQLKAEGAA